MRHLALTDGNYLSHTTRTLAVARALRAAGDEVRVAASGRWAELFDQDGFERREIVTPSPEHIMDYTRRSRMDYLSGELLESLVAADLEAIEDYAPDCVLGDFRWSLSVSTELAGVRYATILNTLWTDHYACIRSVPEGLLLRRLFGERAVAAIGPLVKRVLLRAWARPINRFRRRRGLAAQRNLSEQIYGGLNLLADLVSLFPVRELPDNAQVVGPIFWEGGQTSDPERLPPPSSRPLVYASIGSTGTALLVEKLYAGLGGQEVDVVLSTGGQQLGPPPPANFRCIDFVRAADILPRADLAICHGGNGTVYQCLAHAVPLLGIATHNDQQWNLDRVAALGLGWRTTQEGIDPEEIRAALVAVREDGGWRERCAAMAAEIRACDGPANAARAIREWLAPTDQPSHSTAAAH